MLGKEIRFGLVFAVVILGTLGCVSTPPKAGPPMVLQVPQDQNPEVLWLVRPVEIESKVDITMSRIGTYYGLFACYRPTSPGFPQCFLAKIVGENRNLVWPDSSEKYQMQEQSQ